MEVQVISGLIPLQRPWEGSKLCSSITGHPTLSARFPFGKAFGQSLWVFRSITCIHILNIVPLPFLRLMDGLVLPCQGVGNPRELGKNTVVEPIHYFIASSK